MLIIAISFIIWPYLARLICDKISPIWFGKAAKLSFHSSREVEGPALRNLGNRSNEQVPNPAGAWRSWKMRGERFLG
jgi:hypothetical protein